MTAWRPHVGNRPPRVQFRAFLALKRILSRHLPRHRHPHSSVGWGRLQLNLYI
jgi:hypothetical protein